MKLLKDTFQARSARLRLVACSAMVVAVSLGAVPAAAQAEPGAGTSDIAAPAAAARSSVADQPVAGPGLVRSLRNQNNRSMCLGISGSAHHHGAPAIQWDCLPNELDQKWELSPLGLDVYMLKNQNSANMCLGIRGGDLRHGASAIQWDCDSRIRDQRWDRVDLGEGEYLFVNVNSGLCLGIAGGDLRHGAPAIQWDCDSRIRDQRWTLS